MAAPFFEAASKAGFRPQVSFKVSCNHCCAASVAGGKTSGLDEQRLLIEPLGRRQFASLVQDDGLVEQVLQGLAVPVHGRVDSGNPATWPEGPKARPSAGKSPIPAGYPAGFSRCQFFALVKEERE
jgi:hypothetical protein